MNKLNFQIIEEQGEMSAFFEQDNGRYFQLLLMEIEETEYYVGDSPISDTISGHFDFRLVRDNSIRNKCPYKVVIHSNLVRNNASLEIYLYADRLLEELNTAIQNSLPVKFDIQNDIHNLGWYMKCS